MEVELKWGLVHPGDIVHLLSSLPMPTAVLVQQNHYYSDGEGKLATAKTMVRVREEGRSLAGCTEVDRVVLTVKRRVAKERGVFRAEEVEEEIDASMWRDILFERKTLSDLESEALQELERSYGVDTWHPRGSLTNKRHVIACEGFTLEVDRTTFDDGHVDAEVEVETLDIEGAKALLSRIGEEHGIEFFEQTQGKYSRFLKRRLGT